jgi:hypothetical protein
VENINFIAKTFIANNIKVQIQQNKQISITDNQTSGWVEGGVILE